MIDRMHPQEEGAWSEEEEEVDDGMAAICCECGINDMSYLS